jgi:hypothetical protein
MDFWSRIQTKSSSVKTQYSFLIAGLVTGIIGMVWVSTLPARFSQMAASNETNSEESEDSLGLNDLFNDTKSQLGNIIDTTKESIEEVQPTTNLDSLGTPSVTENEVRENSIPARTSTEPVAVTEEIATTTPEPSYEAKAPKMILIGTTTSQKEE